MTHHFTSGDQLVIATHNKGKLGEFRTCLAPFGIAVSSAGELDLPEPDEDGETFVANALIKARAACKGSGLPSLADDSGLCVNALGGNPGLYSARWCGPNRDPMVGMERVHRELGDSADRSAYFISVIAVAWPDGHEEVFEGRCTGTIIWPPVGENGHGFDPFFLPDGKSETFGQMKAEDKAEISHRARALEAFVGKLCG